MMWACMGCECCCETGLARSRRATIGWGGVSYFWFSQRNAWFVLTNLRVLWRPLVIRLSLNNYEIDLVVSLRNMTAVDICARNCRVNLYFAFLARVFIAEWTKSLLTAWATAFIVQYIQTRCRCVLSLLRHFNIPEITNKRVSMSH